MPIFDQYEVEPASAYSGSYTDNSIFGTIFADNATTIAGYSPLGQGNPTTSRRLIASRIDGKNATYPNINNMWLPAYAIEGYASGSWLGRFQRFAPFFSNEYWYDSFVPNVVEIYSRPSTTLPIVTAGVLNKANSVIGGIDFEVSGSLFDIYPYTNNISDAKISLFIQQEPPIASAMFPPFPNSRWFRNHPFQSFYKNIQRIEEASNTLPDRYNLNINFDGTAVSPVSSSNTLGTICITSDLIINANGGSPQPLLFVGSCMNTPTQPYPNYKFGTAPIVEIYKTFFGTGNGTPGLTRKGASFKYNTTTDLSGDAIRYLTYDSSIRGYKYGIRSIFPEANKIIYRLNHYGHVRDMLEGRPTTATLVKSSNNSYTDAPINRTLFYPLIYGFVSGSAIYTQARDYVTATNPSYNPYDSGIYDIYYRSGQPFFDRGNED
jgi:hypothetical protein